MRYFSLYSESKIVKKYLNYYGIETPYALSSEEWQNHHEKYKNRIPYKLANWLDDFQSFIETPIRAFFDIKWYLMNRFVTKPHYLKTNLKKGRWYEYDERMLHGLFNELILFVEKEKGMEQLEYDLTVESDLSNQKERAEWILRAYYWWKNERPNRMDPYDLIDFDDIPGCLSSTLDKPKCELYLEKYNMINRMEEEYYQEDTRWLHELVDRRRDIWD